MTSSFPSEVRKNTIMYGSILPVTNRPPFKGKTAESRGCVWRGGNRLTRTMHNLRIIRKLRMYCVLSTTKAQLI